MDIPLLPLIMTISGLVVLFFLIGYYYFFWRKSSDSKYEMPLTEFERNENSIEEEEDLHNFTTHQMNKDYYRLM